MPRYVNFDKHCVDCEKFEGCEINKKLASEDFHNQLSDALEKILEVKVWFKTYSLLCLCERFEKRKPRNTIDELYNKVISGEPLTEEEAKLFEKFMEDVE